MIEGPFKRGALLYSTFIFLEKNLPSLPMIFYDRGHGYGHGQNKPRSNTASAATISSSFLIRTGHPIFFLTFLYLSVIFSQIFD